MALAQMAVKVISHDELRKFLLGRLVLTRIASYISRLGLGGKHSMPLSNTTNPKIAKYTILALII